MSFSFQALGTKAQVLEQLRSHHAHAEQQLAAQVRRLVADAMAHHDSPRPPGAAYDYVYVVKATGHAGPGSPVSLSLAIEPLWVPMVDDVVDVAVGEGFVASELGQEAAGL